MLCKFSSKSKMNTQQITAILLSALVGSTLGHEFLRAKRFAPEPKSSKLASPFEDRALVRSHGDCIIVCEPGNNGQGQLQIIYNDTTQLLGIHNRTANKAVVIDIMLSLVVVLDGSIGDLFLLNPKAKTGVYIPGGLTQISWISAKSTFNIYFSKLKSAKIFLDLKIGKTFTFSDISNDTFTTLNALLCHFSADFILHNQTFNNASLTILSKTSLTITKLLTGSLKGLLGSDGKCLIHGDLIWLGAVFEGLDVFFSFIPGGLAAVIAAKIKFDLTILFGAANGLQLFVNILFISVLKGKLALVAGPLSSPDKMLSIIVLLGGNVNTGVTGLCKVILLISLLVSKKIELEVFLHVLALYCASKPSKESLDLSVYTQSLLKIIELPGELPSELTAFGTFVKDLQAGKFVHQNVNMSEIIVILQQGGRTTPLHLVVTILLKLTVRVGFGIVVTIPALFLYLLTKLKTADGITLLNRLGMKIGLSISSGNIVGQLIHGVNVQSILGTVSGNFSVEKLEKEFPVFGQVYHCLYTVLQESSNGKYNLLRIVQSSTQFKNGIQEFVKELTGLTPTTTQKPTTASSSGGGGGGWLGGILGGSIK